MKSRSRDNFEYLIVFTDFFRLPFIHMSTDPIAKLAHLSEATVRAIRDQVSTPTFAYSERALKANAERILSFGGPFGFTAR